jgi:hypothetical protein
MKNVLIPENQQSIENRLIEVSHFLDSLGFSRCGTYNVYTIGWNLIEIRIRTSYFIYKYFPPNSPLHATGHGWILSGNGIGEKIKLKRFKNLITRIIEADKIFCMILDFQEFIINHKQLDRKVLFTLTEGKLSARFAETRWDWKHPIFLNRDEWSIPINEIFFNISNDYKLKSRIAKILDLTLQEQFDQIFKLKYTYNNN